ncbi:glycosyl hydrolase [Gemmatirosa kalamazoonensis]|nr:glycosyl hydrolase [Gemmatirosa kalamazoonensis]
MSQLIARGVHAMLVAACLTIAAPRAHAQAGPLAWSAVGREQRPWTRWWWLGSAVDSAGLTRELRGLAAAGFGGVEVTAIYGAKGADSAYVPYLSPRWVQLLRHAATEARRFGMGLDMPPGSGWRTGGPFVPEADASASLRVTAEPVPSGGTWSADLTGKRIEAVTATAPGAAPVLVARLPAGPLRWTAPAGGAGPWTVYIAETRAPVDEVKRPAPGGEGHAIDPFSASAVRHFLAAYDERTRALPNGLVRAWFHDSYEYTGTGSPELFDTFRRLRGYDLALHLPELLGRGSADSVARVKSDYRETLSDMLLANFLGPLTAWAHTRGGLSRNQAHGSPGNLLDLYAAVDIPETEIFGPVDTTDANRLINKFASSAAHVSGKPLASAESFTWLEEHFSVALDEVKRAADGMFLGGINHLLYHGTAYSPAGIAWPGWEFYASAEFNPRNAFWRDLPAFNRYVARVQSELQRGRPDEDVLLYWPVWDNWHDPAGLRMDFNVRDVGRTTSWLGGKPVGDVAKALIATGVGFDYVSDRLLAAHVTAPNGRLQAGGASYRAIVVPPTQHMPVETMRRLLNLARDGATVVFLGALPTDVPGLAELEARRGALAAEEKRVRIADASGMRTGVVGRGRVLVGDSLATLLDAAGVRREPMTARAGVHFIRRRTDAGHSYFVAHTGNGDAVDGWVALGVRAASVAILDPMTGRTGFARTRRQGDRTEAYLQLDPGESLILRAFDRAVTGAAWPYRTPAGAPVALRGRWTVAFVDGGPTLPKGFSADSLLPWTGLGDADADRFAGTARYALRFDAPGSASDYLLDLGRVEASARVRLNGRDLGTLVARPFRVRTGPLQPSGNVLEVEVTNLSANRVRDLDVRGVPWKIFRDINYVNLDYKPFDASTWPVRTSGLVGPATLTPLASGPRM